MGIYYGHAVHRVVSPRDVDFVFELLRKDIRARTKEDSTGLQRSRY